jgi:hypothetical protein
MNQFFDSPIGKIILGVTTAAVIAGGTYFFTNISTSKANEIQNKNDHININNNLNYFAKSTNFKFMVEKNIINTRLDSVSMSQKEQSKILKEISESLRDIDKNQKTQAQILKQVCKNTKNLNNLVPFIETVQN